MGRVGNRETDRFDGSLVFFFVILSLSLLSLLSLSSLFFVFLVVLRLTFILLLTFLISFFLSLSLQVFEGELADKIPVIHTSIAGCRIIGRLCVGMYYGSARALKSQ